MTVSHVAADAGGGDAHGRVAKRPSSPWLKKGLGEKRGNGNSGANGPVDHIVLIMMETNERKRMIRKFHLGAIVSSLMSVALTLSLAGPAFAAGATDEGVKVINNASTVTVHVYDNDATESNTTGNGSEITETGSLGEAVQGATLGYVKVGEIVQYTDRDSTSIKYAISANAVNAFGWQFNGENPVTIDGGSYYLADSAKLSTLLEGTDSSNLRDENVSGLPGASSSAGNGWNQTLATGEEGSTVVSDLHGLYLFIGMGTPTTMTKEIVPFFVSAPMPSASDAGEWNTSIHAYPKIQTANPATINKTVNGEKEVSVYSGKDLNYKIEILIPTDSNISDLKVTDQIPAGLDGATNVEVTATAGDDPVDGFVGDGVTTSNGSLSYTATEGDRNAIKSVTAPSAGAGQDVMLTISYTTQLNEEAPLASAITGTAALTYQYGTSSPATGTSQATVYTYGIDLTKTFEGAQEYQSGATFALYADEDCKQPVYVKVSGTPGVYWADSTSNSGEMSVTQAADGSSDGTLTLKGLAEGTYYLKETAAPSGYSRLTEPIAIVIDGNGDVIGGSTYVSPAATVNDVAATMNAGGADKAGLAQLKVQNVRNDGIWGLLPSTGEAGTMLLVAVGAGIVCLTTVMLVSNRRRTRSE